eukprot:1748257-Rhodomonas_salina.1
MARTRLAYSRCSNHTFQVSTVKRLRASAILSSSVTPLLSWRSEFSWFPKQDTSDAESKSAGNEGTRKGRCFETARNPPELMLAPTRDRETKPNWQPGWIIGTLKVTGQETRWGGEDRAVACVIESGLGMG